jgi:hypothetical protein
MNYFSFQNVNGNGNLTTAGNADVANWNVTNMITFIDMICSGHSTTSYIACYQIFMVNKYGFRYVRSAE